MDIQQLVQIAKASDSNVVAGLENQPEHAETDNVTVEEGEEMDAVNDDDAVMMAVMGLDGFGSTKVILLCIIFKLNC